MKPNGDPSTSFGLKRASAWSENEDALGGSGAGKKRRGLPAANRLQGSGGLRKKIRLCCGMWVCNSHTLRRLIFFSSVAFR